MRKKVIAGRYNQIATTSDSSIIVKRHLSQGLGRIGNQETIGRRGKECEFVHKGAEAMRPRKRALSRVNRSQIMGRSTPWKGVFRAIAKSNFRKRMWRAGLSTVVLPALLQKAY